MIIMISVAMLAVHAMIAGEAYGQATCNGPTSHQGEFVISPQSGPAGSSVEVSGYYIFNSGLRINNNSIGDRSTPITNVAGPTMVIAWAEGGQVLAELPTEVGQNDTAHFRGTITIPDDAVVGAHDVAFHASMYNDPNCLSFQVTETVSQNAYVQTATSLPASLPSTGVMLITPLAGFMAMAAGGYINRRRNR